jgi:hypothetical protein
MVQTPLDWLTLPKVWKLPFGHLNCGASFGISPNSTFPHLHIKCAKSSYLDTVSASQGRNDFIENRVDHLLDIAL